MLIDHHVAISFSIPGPLCPLVHVSDTALSWLGQELDLPGWTTSSSRADQFPPSDRIFPGLGLCRPHQIEDPPGQGRILPIPSWPPTPLHLCLSCAKWLTLPPQASRLLWCFGRPSCRPATVSSCSVLSSGTAGSLRSKSSTTCYR